MGIGLIAWRQWSSQIEPSKPAATTRDGLPIERDPARWISLLHRGGVEVDLRRELTREPGDINEVSLGTTVGLGPLRPEEVLRMREMVVDLQKLRSQWLQAAQAKFEKTGAPMDNLAFAKCLVDHEEALAATPALTADSYYVQRNSVVPAVSGMRYVGMAVLRGDEQLFVTIALETKNHPALAAAIQYLADTEGHVARTACDEFNAMPLDRRVALVAKYKAASDQAKIDDPELVKFFRPGLMVSGSTLLIRR